MAAFLADPDGLCYYCTTPATTDYFGLALCDKHADEEQAKDMVM